MNRPHGFDPAQRLVDLANLFRTVEAVTVDAASEILAGHGETAADLSALSAADVAGMHRACRRLATVLAESDPDRAAEQINAVLDEFGSRPRLSNHDGHFWHLHTDERGSGWGEWLAASGALALAQLMSERGRIAWGRCAAPGCGRYYLDTGPGSAQRYCSKACATRARVAQHRARQRT